MNKTRRAKIAKIIAELRCHSAELKDLSDEEAVAYESIPEAMQNGQRGEDMLGAIDLIDEASSAVDEAINTLEQLLP